VEKRPNPNDRWERYRKTRAANLGLPASSTDKEIWAREAELAREARAEQKENTAKVAEPVRVSLQLIESKPRKPQRRQQKN